MVKKQYWTVEILALHKKCWCTLVFISPTNIASSLCVKRLIKPDSFETKNLLDTFLGAYAIWYVKTWWSLKKYFAVMPQKRMSLGVVFFGIEFLWFWVRFSFHPIFWIILIHQVHVSLNPHWAPPLLFLIQIIVIFRYFIAWNWINRNEIQKKQKWNKQKWFGCIWKKCECLKHNKVHVGSEIHSSFPHILKYVVGYGY